MELVVRADRLRGVDDSRLHPLRERLCLRHGDQELGELVVAADRLTGERHDPLVSGGVQLAALDRGLVIDPPRVIAGELGELIHQPLNASRVENPAGTLLANEAGAPKKIGDGLPEPPFGVGIEGPNTPTAFVDALGGPAAAPPERDATL